MAQDRNQMMKKFLEKIISYLLTSKKYKSFHKVEVFFVFGSQHKTAMCDWVYGMKIYTPVKYNLRDDLVREFQMDIRKKTDQIFNQSVCATDIMFEN